MVNFSQYWYANLSSSCGGCSDHIGASRFWNGSTNSFLSAIPINATPSLNASIAVTLTAFTASLARTTPALRRSRVVIFGTSSSDSLDLAFPCKGNNRSKGFRRSNIPIVVLYEFSFFIALQTSVDD